MRNWCTLVSFSSFTPPHLYEEGLGPDPCACASMGTHFCVVSPMGSKPILLLFLGVFARVCLLLSTGCSEDLVEIALNHACLSFLLVVCRKMDNSLIKDDGGFTPRPRQRLAAMAAQDLIRRQATEDPLKRMEEKLKEERKRGTIFIRATPSHDYNKT